MMYLLALLLAPPAEDKAERQATASVQIVRPVRATRETWKETPPSRRKEIKVREADGRVTRVRVIEFE